MPSPDSATAPLPALRERLDALDARALAELDAAWQDLRDILERHRAVCEATALPGSGDVDDVATFRTLREETLRNCLTDPLAALERAGPDRRAGATLALHTRTTANWVRGLPEMVHLDGPGVLGLADAWGAPSRWSFALSRMSGTRAVPLRAIAARQAARAGSVRAHADAELVAALADGLRQFGRHWSLSRLALDSHIDRSVDRRRVERAAERVNKAAERVHSRMQSALERRQAFDASVLPSVGAAVVRGVLLRRSHTNVSAVVPPPADWTAAFRQVRAELSLHHALEECEVAVLRALDESIAAARAEGAALAAEVERMAQLLPRHDAGAEDLAASIEHMTTVARLAEFDRVMEQATAALPDEAIIAPTYSHGRARGFGARGLYARRVRPAAMARATYHSVIRPALMDLFEHIETDHGAIAGDIARARDVVMFAARAARDGDASEAVVEEAVDNAVALLNYRRSAPVSPLPVMRAAKVVCHAFGDVHVFLFGGRSHRWTHVVRRQLERGLPVATAALLRAIGSRVTRASHGANLLSRRFLARIGWRPDSSAGVVDVRIRPVLPDTFAGDAEKDNLPALYRHLFRPDPVRDVRFLVGRAPELDAIADARARWEAGRSAAVLVTGERGSGKTSLINCALDGPLAGLSVVRGEFTGRLLHPDGVRSEIARIVGAPGPQQIEEYLMTMPRVVVLEEVERTFLRHLGHYDAVRALGRLISATGGTVLWVVVLNRVAFRFLDAVVGIGQRFSHRINASSATTDDLRKAILIRHNLSGLRLKFTPPAGRRFGRRVDPERAFFEMTARHSAGVYRTAFSIWLGHIAEIREGLLSVRAPEERDLLPVVADLSVADLFSLVAFMQHGSLTPEEHAIVFQQHVDISRAQMDELIAREIIASEPARPGYRVRPEAMSVVQEALYRRNLL